jgi:hypothetical protein
MIIEGMGGYTINGGYQPHPQNCSSSGEEKEDAYYFHPLLTCKGSVGS